MDRSKSDPGQLFVDACSSTFIGPFKLFDCSSICQMDTSDSIVAFDVQMRSLDGSALDINPLLKVWFSDTDPADADISDISSRFVAPNLLSGWRLLPGYQWRAEIGLTKRKFIVSSFFHDVIVGNYPNYLTVNLRPIATVSTLARTNSSIAGGLIFPATQGSSAMMDADIGLSDARSYVGCEVIEEYRDSSAFDILGSIGGLLALVQGIYIWLVGRPLLWGLTGAKPISPFGLMGSFTLPGFRKRLREHYHTSASDCDNLKQDSSLEQDEDRIRMVAFLLDYVIDMGPLNLPTNDQDEHLVRRIRVQRGIQDAPRV
ncbi:hypothetical protein FRC12_023596 [Ceratobasidium sp. 428]|nr:hypothetical protein FRC12_023596 [Ceratobasidium sp. 428]